MRKKRKFLPSVANDFQTGIIPSDISIFSIIMEYNLEMYNVQPFWV